MSTLVVMTRLQLNWAEVPGVMRAFLYGPSQKIDQADLPCVYPVQLGRQAFAVPGQSDTSLIPLSAGQYVVERQYIYRALIAEAESSSVDSGDLGAYVDELAVTFIDAPTDYFLQHPRLKTATLPDLAGILRDVTIQDSGPVTRLGPSGARYIAIDYTLTVAERRVSRRIS